jgi:hypothetical protein
MSASEQPTAFEGSIVEAGLLELGRLYKLALLHGWQSNEDDEEEIQKVRQRWKKLKDRCEATGAGLAEVSGVEK